MRDCSGTSSKGTQLHKAKWLILIMQKAAADFTQMKEFSTFPRGGIKRLKLTLSQFILWIRDRVPILSQCNGLSEKGSASMTVSFENISNDGNS